MSDTSQIATDSELSVIKLKDALLQLSERTRGSSDASIILSEAMALFKSFFENIADPDFKPRYLKTGDIVSSEIYNQNLATIHSDISRFYKELNNLTTANIKSFNYAQIVTNEIRTRANALAGLVLDLSIINNFTRGDVIVAGDDFINLDKVNSSAPLSANKAELVYGGSGLSLARASTKRLTSDPAVTIQVVPVAPQSKTSDGVDQVNTSPTPGNFNRFYEGNYYNFLGAARPEGGRFNIQFVLDPRQVKTVQEGDDPETPNGIFLEYGASEEEKAQTRKAMLDGNPDTFWECEYVIKLSTPVLGRTARRYRSLINNNSANSGPLVTESEFSDSIVQDTSKEGAAPEGAAVRINVDELDMKALTRDTVDLVVDIIVTIPQDQNINFVSINPVVFSRQAFIEVVDISTASSTDTEFTTVDGWDRLRFPKTITPEANEFLADSQIAATLAPSRFSYSGQGIYPFPLRFANKVKIRISVSNPGSNPYERTHVLLTNTIDVETTVTTTKERGRLR